MNIRFRKLPDIYVFDVSGDVVGGDAISLYREMENVARSCCAGAVVLVNLTQMRVVDSFGIGALLALRTASKNSGIPLKIGIIANQPRLLQLLSVVGLDNVFERFPDAETALFRLTEDENAPMFVASPTLASA